MTRVCLSLHAIAILSLGAASCTVSSEEELPPSTPITTAEAQRLALDPQLSADRDRLLSHGYRVPLEEGLVYRAGEHYAAVFPVESATGGASDYLSLTYQEVEGRASVFLEPGDPAAAPPTDAAATAAVSCGPWGGWTTLSTWCEGVFPSCFWEGFNGTKRREWRGRTCKNGNESWLETEYQTTLANCGC
jgi:hypothetical protein